MNSNSCCMCHCEEDMGSDVEDKLISPCKCKGTIGFVHMSCLQQWIRISQLKVCRVCGEIYSIPNVKQQPPAPVNSFSEERRRCYTELCFALLLYCAIATLLSCIHFVFQNSKFPDNEFAFAIVSILFSMFSVFAVLLFQVAIAKGTWS